MVKRYILSVNCEHELFYTLKLNREMELVLVDDFLLEWLKNTLFKKTISSRLYNATDKFTVI